MKNEDIIALVNAGVLEMTSFCLSTDEAYSLYKFRKSLRIAYGSICMAEQELLHEAGINDTAEFERNVAELQKKTMLSHEESVAAEGLMKQKEHFIAMRTRLLKDKTDIAYSVNLPYTRWRELQAENREKSHLSGKIEEMLEGILWTADN